MTTPAYDNFSRFRFPESIPEQILAGMSHDELREHLRALQVVTEATLAHLDLDELLHELLRRLQILLRVDTVTVLLCSEGGRTLVVRASQGLEEEVEQHVEIPLGQGIAGAVAARRQAVIVDDVSRVATASPLLRRLCSMMVAPLVAEGELLGVLHVGSLHPRAFSDAELYLLQVSADRVALAVRNALTHERLAHEAAERASARAERERLVAEVEHQRGLLQTVTDNATSALMMMDTQGRGTFWNRAAERITGYTAEEAMGRTLHELVHHTHPDGTPFPIEDCPIDLALPHGVEVEGHEDIFIRKDGTFFPVVCAAKPILEAGRPAGTVIEVRDVTERSAAEAALRESEGRFRAMADTAPVLIWTSGTDMLCDWFNRPWLEFTGRSMEQELGNGWAEGVHPGDFQRCLDVYQESFAARRSFSMEYRLRRHDGEFRWMLDNGTPRFAPDGTFLGYIGSLVDIHEQVEHREALEEAVRAKSAFVATMSHELRTPINAVVGYAELLELGVPEPLPAGALRQVERIRIASRNLLSMVEEILRFARLEAGREELELQPFDACDLVEEVEAVAEPLAAAKGLSIRVDASGRLPMVSDPRKLRQVLIGLLDNAVKFTTQGGIRLAAWTEGEEVLFQVRDTGPGIAPEHRQRIFQPFWQSDQSMTRTVEGAGLGLAVTARLVDALGGSITVESEPGQGAAFTVRLPRSLAQAN